MNQESAKAYLEALNTSRRLVGYTHLIEALAAGKQLQHQSSQGNWFDIYDPAFDSGPERYRVAPSKAPDEVYLVVNTTSGRIEGAYTTFQRGLYDTQKNVKYQRVYE